MIETRHFKYRNCDIDKIYKRIDQPSIQHEYMIEIKYFEKNTIGCSYHSVTIDKWDLSKLISDLHELKKKDKTRICLAYGGQDIDIKREGNKFYIMHSPSSALYQYFYFDLAKISILIDTFTRIVKQ